MGRKPGKLLYVYKERIPEDLKNLVLSSIPNGEFEVDEMTYSVPETEKFEKMEWAEVVLFAPGRHLVDEVFQHAKHVKLMQLWSSGYDKFNIDAARKYGIPVANNGGANAISVAEHTIMLMLAVYKWLPDSHSRTVEGRWAGNSHGMDMFLLHEKTLGLIGFGNIGQQVARRARGFGIRVIYYDPVKAPPDVEESIGVEYCEFEELIRVADIVSLHVHLNEDTTGMLGKKELSEMKRSATVINVSRAQLVNHDALLEALKSGEIWAAGLDVHAQEPTCAEDPLLTHPRVVATPHMAGSTYDAYAVAMKNAVENFRTVLRGERPRWIVNGV